MSSETSDTRGLVLLTGATGFIGRHLEPRLTRAGWSVRGLTRRPEQARARWPERSWVGGDVDDARAMAAALNGCRAAFYLVHGLAEGPGYRHREVAAAERFCRVAKEAGLDRIVYLGGVAPQGTPSEHLRSRLEVGEALRAGPVPALELRASMIVGHGSQSWMIVRDLAARLPVMVLPRWLRSRSEPVALDDVLVALERGLSFPLAGSTWRDLPGPRVLTGREMLEEVATLLGHAPPRMIEVPLLSPRLSSYWLRLVTRARWSIARELVLGLTSDLLARDDRYWSEIGHARRIDFTEAARRALAAERVEGTPAGAWGLLERRLRHG